MSDTMSLDEAIKIHFQNLRWMEGPAFAETNLSEKIDELEKLIDDGEGKEGIEAAEEVFLSALVPYEFILILAAAASNKRLGGRATNKELRIFAKQMRDDPSLVPEKAQATTVALEIVNILENPFAKE